MATTTLDVFGARPGMRALSPWLRSRNWDLTFITFSVVTAAIPYSIYLLLGGNDPKAQDTARLVINLVVSIAVGGPHMYATFTRTVLDPDFVKRRPAFIVSSLIIPAAVIFMAVSSYETYVWLLTIFFGVAALHALQQILWLTEAYNTKAHVALSLPSRLIDYAVVLTSLYPIAMWKMVRGEFAIGEVTLKVSEVLRGQTWIATLVSAAFALSLIAFIVKTYLEYRAGYVNVPKLTLIGVTVLLMFFTPAFSNMDTAFQGINTWHSFQYLALTWYANRLAEQKTGQRRGLMHTIFSQPGNGWWKFYLVCMAMLPISGLLFLGANLIWPNLHAGQPGAAEVYGYIAILSILLVHYYHDAFLFTKPDALVAET
jgi:hypothetical protein